MPTRSRADGLVSQIGALIASGELAAGSYFSESEMAARFGVSRTPVRRAIAALEAQGLVESIPQVGTRVLTPSESGVEELLELRAAVEGLVVARVAELQPPGTVDALDDHLDRMRFAAEHDHKAEFLTSDTDFHCALAEQCEFEIAADLLRTWGARIRHVGFAAIAAPGRMTAVLGEHRAVRDAIATGRADAAREAMFHHLGTTGARVGVTVEVPAG